MTASNGSRRQHGGLPILCYRSLRAIQLFGHNTDRLASKDSQHRSQVHSSTLTIRAERHHNQPQDLHGGHRSNCQRQGICHHLFSNSLKRPPALPPRSTLPTMAYHDPFVAGLDLYGH